MKQRIAILLTVLLLLSAAACGRQSETSPVETAGKTPSKEETQAEEVPAVTTEEAEEAWGVRDSVTVGNEGKLVNLSFCFPVYTGIPESTAVLAYQDDNTRILVDVYFEGISPEVESLEAVLPAYFEQTEMVFSTNYGVRYQNASFTLESQELVHINDYDMCKYTGKHSFEYSDTDYTYAFVAYAIQLKENGGYVYWLVQDESQDQSMGETIESHAYNMAMSIFER